MCCNDKTGHYRYIVLFQIDNAVTTQHTFPDQPTSFLGVGDDAFPSSYSR